MPASHVSPSSPRASSGDTPEAGIIRRLASLLVEAAERDDATPCLIARNLESPVVRAMMQALPAMRANGLAPLLLLAERPNPDRAPKGVSIRTVTPDIASLLREQVIAGDFVWCGGSAARNDAPTDGRLFQTLAPAELRAFAIVFQGLWASGRPLPAAQVEASPAPLANWRKALASSAR